MDPTSLSTMGTRLRHVVTLLDGSVDEAYRRAGLDFRSVYTPVVRILLDRGTASVRQLAEQAGTTHSAMSQTVAQMRRAGLLDSAAGHDRRERRVGLSERARQQLPVIRAQWEATELAAGDLARRAGVDLSEVANRVIDELDRQPFRDQETLPAVRWLDEADQRTALDQVAALISGHYFDPDAAGRIAREVTTVPLVAGGTTSTELSDRLTSALRAHDAHFSVRWGPWHPTRRRAPRTDTSSPALEFRGQGTVGVVTVHRFEDADETGPRDEAMAVLEQAAHTRAVVLDLRDVPGGWPSMVELLVGALAGPEPVRILTFRSRDGSSETWSRPLPTPSPLAAVPLFVVVNGGTASAAESLTYALQGLGRATVVGTPTAGAANPGEPFDTDTGFSVFVSTASPLDPRTHGNWEGVGVRPDVEVTDDPLGHALVLAREAGAGSREPGAGPASLS